LLLNYFEDSLAPTTKANCATIIMKERPKVHWEPLTYKQNDLSKKISSLNVNNGPYKMLITIKPKFYCNELKFILKRDNGNILKNDSLNQSYYFQPPPKAL